MWYIHKMEHYPVIRTDEMLPFIANWQDADKIICNETNLNYEDEHYTNTQEKVKKVKQLLKTSRH